MADRDIREPLDEIGSRTVACFTRVRYASAHLTVWKRWPLGLPADAGLQTIFVIKLCNMKKLITALVGQPKNVGVAVAALLTAGQLRSEEYCARAAECQGIADHWPDLIKQQYEDLARQWRALAERAQVRKNCRDGVMHLDGRSCSKAAAVFR